MAYKNPPLETRFPVNRPYAPHTQKGQYLTPLLKRLLNKKTNIADPEVQKILNGKIGNKKGTFKAILMLRYILNGVQGENQAIEGILDRIDGKVNGNPLVDQSKNITIIWQESDGNGKLRNKNTAPLKSVEGMERRSTV